MDQYKLHVRVGNSEFRAVGPEETVRDQFDRFMSALATLPAAPVNGTVRPNRQPASVPGLPDGYHDQFDDGLDEPGSNDDAHLGNGAGGHSGPVDGELLSRAFRNDGEIISLRVLPDGKDAHADALLLLIYGFQTINGVNEVGAMQLTEAARQSGINLARIDRTIAKLNGHVRKGGFKRGTRYQINNPGIAKAEGMLRKMFG